MDADHHGHFPRQQCREEGGSPLRHSMANFDEEDFRPHLDGLDISDAQASDLMVIIWNIMRMWVEMDLPADSCEQIVRIITHPSSSDSDDIK